MKKQIQKLNLNKKTILNLTVAEMSKHVGGGRTYYRCHTGGNWCGNGRTLNGNTCPGHNTCNSCVTC